MKMRKRKFLMINQQMNDFVQKIEADLTKAVPASPLNTNLEESMRYSLEAGGKRIRPLLLLVTLDMLTHNSEQGMRIAIALEMIHTYSLIHDDLPAMDNDDYRRGKLTNHKVYGDWKAILAGDALLTKAFEMISFDEQLTSDIKVQLIQRLSQASGHLGMVGGQVLDMESENTQIDLATLQQIHRAKTGALLEFAIMAAVDIAKPSEATEKALEKYGQHLGLMFQIKDDLLDVFGDEAKLGKKVGSDIENNKSTYVSLLGEQGAKDKLNEEMEQAYGALRQIDSQYDTTHLETIIEIFNQRNH